MGRTIDIDDIMKKKGTKLMDIRNGKYVDENNMPIKEFFEMVDDITADFEKEESNFLIFISTYTFYTIS